MNNKLLMSYSNKEFAVINLISMNKIYNKQMIKSKMLLLNFFEILYFIFNYFFLLIFIIERSFINHNYLKLIYIIKGFWGFGE